MDLDVFDIIDIDQLGVRFDDERDTDPNYIEFFIILLGDSNVGKTSILNVLKENKNEPNTKDIALGNKMAKFNVFDITRASGEKFAAKKKRFIQIADGIVLTYDVTNKSSFLNLQKWLAEIKSNAKSDVLILLIGNKCDLEASREVTFVESQELFKKESKIIMFFETSIFNITSICTAFVYLRNKFVERWQNDKCHIL